MFVGGFLLGYISSILSLWLGWYSSRHLLSMGKDETISIPPIFTRRKEKKKPKAISDLELWQREQKEAPADPMFKP